MGVKVCRCSGSAVSATLVIVVVDVLVVVDDDDDVVVVADGVVVSPLFPATEIGMTASSVAMFFVISAFVL